MGLFYKSKRVGKKGKTFTMYKLQTLNENSDLYAQKDNYTRFGWFLRKTKADELPSIINWLKGDMAIVGPRPEEQRTIDVLPKDIRDILLSVKPGMTSLASIYFFDEEKILQMSKDPQSIYWNQIKPMKILLDVFYIRNKSLSLDFWIIYATIKRIIKSLFL